MSGDGEGIFVAFVLTFFAGLIIGAMICIWAASTVWEASAIDHGAAHYDAKTGEFTWNEEGDDEAD